MMRGYKVFNPDWTCRDFHYKVGITYEMDGKPECCKKGFHFCEKLIDCFDYYPFDKKNKVAEVEALGEIDKENDKTCTNKIKIVRELSWEEVLKLTNIGKRCVGKGNTGEENFGHYNSGSNNDGTGNSGYCNQGNKNTGDYNIGSGNSGNYNRGRYNTGNYNRGNHNCGHFNVGNFNTGRHNIGNFNTGCWNKTSFSSGGFNTEEQTILMFNKPSNWTLKDLLSSKAVEILARRRLNKLPVKWISAESLTEEEKEQHPNWETTEGYLEVLEDSEDSAQIWWYNLSSQDKQIILSLPNFDANIFKEITGIDVNKLSPLN